MGKTVLVTGGGTGIGREIALAFARAGYDVAICGRRPEPCARTCDEIRNTGVRSIAIACDVADPESVRGLFDKLASQIGHVDVLVNSAGVPGAAQPFMSMDIERWNSTLQINLTGVMLCSQSAAKLMATQGGGRIINIASAAAFKVIANSADYCASKAAVVQLTKAMAIELVRHKILVNCICPGFFETDFAPSLSEGASASPARWVPAGSIGDPKDLGDLAVFLASDSAAYFVGSILTVDGGLVLK